MQFVEVFVCLEFSKMNLRVEFILILFGTAKENCVIKTKEIFTFDDDDDDDDDDDKLFLWYG